ncbi:hypothetical protein JOM56_009110, partial [Amanita muscaria]
LSFHTQLTEENFGDAATLWATQRMSLRKNHDLSPPMGGTTIARALLSWQSHSLYVSCFVEEFKVPYIWMHERGYICHFDM